MLQTSRHVSCLEASDPGTDLAVHPSSWPITATLLLCHVLREGLAAHHHYEEARCRGIPHDTAIRRAFGISHLDKRSPTSQLQSDRLASSPLHRGASSAQSI